ncbi:DgyrCDS7739 [Dimorphilus gyrociliatus]|uniref:DgyrCDS7739 n=1 Tax=Dimorphilus gyrociliatus TaxID=2664684 RepID=A0A7I8VTQ2_9ANNE|nr:DgyrCDS7739 [Dimorphilus gyrociliatus]
MIEEEDSERTALLTDRNYRIVNLRQSDNGTMGTYKTYKRRWIILFVLFLTSLSNAMIWISYSPIADKAANFYNVSAKSINWFALIYMVICIPFGFCAAWLLDTRGLRITLLLAAYLNVLGSGLRVLASFLPKGEFSIAITGQGIAALAQPLAVFAPTKLSALWFSEHQRTRANTVASMANPAGALLGSLIAPVIVYNNDRHLIGYLNIGCLGLAAIPAILGTFTVCSSIPPSPPSASAAEPSQTFFRGLKMLKSNKPFWLLCLCFGSGLGTFTAVSALIEQILCPWGYNSLFAGICGALLIVFGLIGSAIIGQIVDRTRKFEEIVKIGFSFASIAFLAFVVVHHYTDIKVAVGACISLFGLFAVSLYPVCNELAVECTFPVAEGTSSGLLFIAGQVIGVVMLLVSQAMASASPVSTPYQQCEAVSQKYGVEPYDYTYALLFMAIILSLCTLSLVSFFRCTYRRLKAEEELAAENILQSAVHRN